MKKITLLWCALFSVMGMMYAQTPSEMAEITAYQNSQAINNSRSIQEILSIYDGMDKSGHDYSDALLNQEEQAMLKSYLKNTNRSVLADFIPTAGATETFNLAVGDHFFDPGGPGGSSTGGTPGNYPNCGCITTTTLNGPTEIQFLDFSVFATFDWLIIYDGTDTTGPELYNNFTGGANQGDITLADMIASNGSASFVGTSGSMTFEFRASAVVDYGGWDVEVISDGGPPPPAGASIANVLNLRASCTNDFGTFGVDGPYTIASAGINANSIFAGDFDNNDVLYAFDNTTQNLITIDPATGMGTDVGPTLNNNGEALTALGWNESDTTMYAMTMNTPTGGPNSATVYTVDLATGELTVVANALTPNGDELFAWLAIDNDGNAYALDLVSDSLYSIDLADASSALIGSLGFTPNINFAQDADFDPETGVLYAGVYTGGGTNQWSSIDTTTGLATQLGSVNMDCAELGVVAILGENTGGGMLNQWTVNVQGPPFGDEVSWELRDNTGAVILSGGPYGAVAYDDTQMVDTMNEPLEFFIESEGAFGNNTPTYTVSCSGNVIITGTLAGGETSTTPGLECSGVVVPSNDFCENAIEVACGDVIAGDTSDDTDSGGNAAPDEFYKYTGDGIPLNVTLSLCDGGTAYDSLIRVFTDCTLATEVANNDDSCGLQSELEFESDGVSTYYIMIEGFGNNSGAFSLAVTCASLVENDLCENAISLECGDSVTGTTTGALPDNDVAGVDCGTTITSPGVWYVFDDTSGLSGDITATLCNGTDFDSKISVFTGDCNALVCLDGNDDDCGLQSTVTFPTDGATTFYILVHGFGAGTGNFTLDVTCMPTPPPNDMIANSIDVDEIGFPYTDPAVAMPAATLEAGDPADCSINGSAGVWYNFVSAGNGTATASITSPSGASAVIFYSAPDENASETDLVHVDQFDNQCLGGTSATIATTAGQAYYLFVVNSGAVTDIVIDGTLLGTDENAIEGFVFYPNPANDKLNINAQNTIDSVSLYNILGQTVLNQNVGATSSQLDVSSLSTGTYVMKVSVDGVIGTYKVIKQ
ncbi:MAG: T9SS type A sorting domain-containing protein [Patiriisocius sp.]|uniref:T9SS type A sorting domain-containing protein n=1 Tax=Patiriisocius sp. TaxID=2822396 RepID=UPI003EF9145F